MALAQLSLFNQAVLVLASLALLTSFIMLAQGRKLPLIYTYGWQGVLLAVTTAFVAYVTGNGHLYISAALTLALKAILIPWLLHRLAVRLNVQREIEPIAHPSLLLFAGAALVVFSYYVSLPIVHLATAATRNIIAVSMSIVLLGMLLMITRRRAMAQVIGFMSMENGLFFAGVVATYGMPMIVELGIAFDVLVAAILFGVFFFQIRASIDSLDVDRLSRLSEMRESAPLAAADGIESPRDEEADR